MKMGNPCCISGARRRISKRSHRSGREECMSIGGSSIERSLTRSLQSLPCHVESVCRRIPLSANAIGFQPLLSNRYRVPERQSPPQEEGSPHDLRPHHRSQLLTQLPYGL